MKVMRAIIKSLINLSVSSFQDIGTKTCGGFPGIDSNYQKDAQVRGTETKQGIEIGVSSDHRRLLIGASIWSNWTAATRKSLTWTLIIQRWAKQ